MLSKIDLLSYATNIAFGWFYVLFEVSNCSDFRLLYQSVSDLVSFSFLGFCG